MGKKRLSKKEYNKLKHSAYELVVMQGYDQKEVAKILCISEQTVSAWSQEGGWINEQKARQQCFSSDTTNTKEIIKLLSEKRLSLEMEIRDAEKEGDKDLELSLRKEARALSDEIAKHNKTLMNLDKENKVSLGAFIDVMDEVFNSLRVYDEELWEKTIMFQESMIRRKTNELG